jgi:hypothetical protein
MAVARSGTSAPGKSRDMPLSEDEQRILQEIEAQFFATDPGLARQVSETTLYRHASRNIKWAALGFVTGFIVMIYTFTQGALFGLLGFFAMLGSAFIIERNLRKLGRAGIESLSASMKSNRLRTAFGDAGKRMRGRFRRDDES